MGVQVLSGRANEVKALDGQNVGILCGIWREADRSAGRADSLGDSSALGSRVRGTRRA